MSEFQVKPPLYIFDQDQTHDLLFLSHVFPSLAVKLENETNGRFLVQGYNLIDRYVPNDVFPWAESWAIKAFDFAKKLARTNRSSLSGAIYDMIGGTGLDSDTAIDIQPNPTAYNFSIPNEIQVVIKPKSEAIISWLSVSKSLTLPSYSILDEIFQIRIFERLKKTFLNNSDEDVVIVVDCTNIALFSMVFTDCNPVDEEISKHFNYENMEATLERYFDSFGDDGKVLSGYTFKAGLGFIHILEAKRFSTVSSNYYRAGLLFANNNPWGNVLDLPDLGYIPTFSSSWFLGISKDSPFPIATIKFLEDYPPISGWVIDGNESSWIPSLAVDFNDYDNTLVSPEVGYYIWNNYPPEGSFGIDLLFDDGRLISATVNVSYSLRSEFTPLEEEATLEEIQNYLLSENNVIEELMMADSVRIKEIHEALEADTYASNGDERRVANLGWLINKISHVLGLHFAPDGRMAKPPDTKHYKDGAKIPENWQIGQFGKHRWKDDKGDFHDGVGIAYEVRSNTFGSDGFTGDSDSIEEGGWVTCNSLLQFLETKFDDDDRAFGLQEMGADILPSADGQSYIAYQGMHSLLSEIAYMLSAISANTSQTHVLALKNNALAMENLAAHGSPVEIKKFIASIGGEDIEIPFPGIKEGSPTQVDLAVWILSNLAPLLASSITLSKEDS